MSEALSPLPQKLHSAPLKNFKLTIDVQVVKGAFTAQINILNMSKIKLRGLQAKVCVHVSE